jgi:Flp pilus assembly protein TadG
MFNNITNNRGQSLVEFAIILPFFVMLLFMVVQFSLVFHDYLVLSEAAREGARLASVGKTDGEIIATAKTIVQSNAITLKLDAAGLGGLVTVTPGQPRKLGDQVTILVSAPVQTSIPFLTGYMPPNLFGKVAMRMEMDTP